jgi:hypothetical protein
MGASKEHRMRNPWTAKNPFMSAWLSAAHTVGNTARGHATVAAQRQFAAMQADAAKQVADFWSGAWMLPTAAAPTAQKKKRRTRRSSGR